MVEGTEWVRIYIPIVDDSDYFTPTHRAPQPQKRTNFPQCIGDSSLSPTY
nr:hypothetical protein KXZ65_23105 [Pectobacterium sp. PL152]